MRYSPREALTVAVYNSGVQPLHDAFELSSKLIEALKNMGFEIVDVDKGVANSAADAAFAAYQAARRAKHPVVSPSLSLVRKEP